ncbi:MAG TPA: dephospho-CoA kinase [Methylophilaceae bacterium]|nr:dephospho-CoA kinase [Methylophilaceae bacterium]
MFTIALTGGIGSGKSEATKIFSSLGVPIVDLDIISHGLTAEKQPLASQIAEVFGQEYISSSGALDRTKMRQLVFDNYQARKKLNKILHPAIYKEAIKQLQQYRNQPYVVLAIPLLEENSIYAASIDRVLVIDCDQQKQIERVKQRSNLTEPEIKQIIEAQMPRQSRINMADDLIENNGSVADLRRKIEKLHQKYIKTCIVSKTIS